MAPLSSSMAFEEILVGTGMGAARRQEPWRAMPARPGGAAARQRGGSLQNSCSKLRLVASATCSTANPSAAICQSHEGA